MDGSPPRTGSSSSAASVWGAATGLAGPRRQLLASGAMQEETPRAPLDPTTVWAPPAFEIIALDCEITAYAPDGDDPLF